MRETPWTDNPYADRVVQSATPPSDPLDFLARLWVVLAIWAMCAVIRIRQRS